MSVCSWQGQRYYLSLGVPDTAINRKAAEQKARQIELDFVSGNFDPTLDKYRPENVPKGKAQEIHPNALHLVAVYGIQVSPRFPKND